ncbi:SWIM zinc finger family protein [Lyngbya sp. CCY1209]|uniref:SWIM zinc finger family protein n=1 Tax=Lyngbya sp. CCY1209 TaxID=2886103 RepID=UPI002D2152C6|nr:SWIM zinc finger family protein [Lyngbya sp. CCY1209]MEB3885814.1 SWIM zinc finger family protein [Lyngbya sp. CCY1209]
MVNYNSETDREWWTQQWLDILNRYRFKKRLERARNYARQGNVLSIEFSDRRVLAKVQGTQPQPYEVALWLDVFGDEEWGYVIETLSQRAIFSAKLLAGEMPQNIEDVFAQNGLRLFPFNLDEVHSQCSCPDKANPCKHIGAVYYMLGDRFSEDPFVLFQLRGRMKDDIIAKLRQLRGSGEGEKVAETEEITTQKIDFDPPSVAGYWEYNQQLEPSLVVISPPPGSETVLDVLGPIPLATAVSKEGGRSATAADVVMQYLDTVYKNVSQQAVLMGLNRESEG